MRAPPSPPANFAYGHDNSAIKSSWLLLLLLLLLQPSDAGPIPTQFTMYHRYFDPTNPQPYMHASMSKRYDTTPGENKRVTYRLINAVIVFIPAYIICETRSSMLCTSCLELTAEKLFSIVILLQFLKV